MGSKVSLPTGRTSFSVISAKASAALRWRSTLSEKERVVSAVRGEPAKKLVVVRSVPCVLRYVKFISLVNTYSRGTVTNLPPPPAHSRGAMVHMSVPDEKELTKH